MKIRLNCLAERKGFELSPLPGLNVFNGLNAGEARKSACRGRICDNCATRTAVRRRWPFKRGGQLRS
jgi:hypothetical protein